MILGEETPSSKHLPMEIVGGKQEQILTGFNLPPEGISMEKVEEALVRKALIMTCGNQTKSARLLDISRDSLRYRMQKFGIKPPPLKKLHIPPTPRLFSFILPHSFITWFSERIRRGFLRILLTSMRA